MATIYIDNRQYSVADGDNLLKACLQLGFDVPYFCWHPAVHSIGACRQCAVKQFRDEKDTRGRIVMACMTPAAEGTRISIDNPEVKAFRASVIEWLMVNHPHDCPVCDEGGECHLQDMTVMTGHTYRRYRFAKRTYRNQYLGPFVNHEMNRCIQCYRCVRFYCDYAGGRDFGVFGSRDHVYFGRQQDGVLEDEFSGNLVEVCPTGVFTDATLKQHYTRKWDIQTAPSICVHCGLGCNIIPGERYGTLRRISNRYNGEVNRYFICDRGRYGYEFVNSPGRVRQPLALATVGGDLPGAKVLMSKRDVLERLGTTLRQSKGIIGVGSARASLEANFALRTMVGAERFFAGVSDLERRVVASVLDVLRRGPSRSASLRMAESADAVFVLGEDVTNTAPRLALALRQSVRQAALRMAGQLKIPPWHDAAVRELGQDRETGLFITTVGGTKLDEVAGHVLHVAPDDIARVGAAVARALGQAQLPAVDLSDDSKAFVDRVVAALQAAQAPLVVAGSSLGNEAMLQASAAVAEALCSGGREAMLSFILPQCNSLGLGLLEAGPLSAAMQVVDQGAADTVIVLENDLYRHADARRVDSFLSAARHVIVLDCIGSETCDRADVVLPAASFAEGDGTLVSSEGRAQRFFQVFVPEGDIQESWRWLRDIMVMYGRAVGEAWQNLDDVIGALAMAIPELAVVRDVAPPASFRAAKMKIPREHPRYSGRTAMRAHITVGEECPPEDTDAPLAFSMEGYDGRPPSALIPRFRAPGWNSIQSLHKFQSEIGGALIGGDPGRRLFEPRGQDAVQFWNVPDRFSPRPDEWLLVAIQHIFGSEEQSALSPPVAERAPRPYLAVAPSDARLLNLRAGDGIAISLGGRDRSLTVRESPNLPPGVAGLPAGLPGLVGIELPTWCRLGEYRRRESGS